MPSRGAFLNSKWAIALLALMAAIPLIWPQIPPLVDLPGHMGRYRIAEAVGQVPSLAAAYSFEWKLIGNLGVDLLIVPMSALVGLELGTKLIVISIPVLTVLGMLLVARQAHGSVPPASLLALPLAWSYPFHFGFINFSLSVGLAWLALWLWLKLQPRPILRAALFLFVSCLLWVTHMVGWGLFGLAAFGVELVARRRSGASLSRAVISAGLACLPLALPLIPMLLSREVSSGAGTFDWFNWQAKQLWLTSLLRDRWQLFDVLCAWMLILLAGIAAARRSVEPLLAVPALMCGIAFLVMPRVAVGSAYADMRLLPFAVGLALLSIRTADRWVTPMLAAGLIFFLVRLGATTASLGLYDQSYRDELRAIDRIPRGASVLSLVVRPCTTAWATERLDHLPSLVIIRKDGFSNDQWVMSSASGLQVIKPGAVPYQSDPSQLIYPKNCRGEGSDLNQAAATFDRNAFDFLWVIGGRVSAADLRPVWSNGHSVLYRVMAGRGSG